jgi:hypothetical protein
VGEGTAKLQLILMPCIPLDAPRKLEGDAATQLLMSSFDVPVETLYRVRTNNAKVKIH